MRYSPKDVHNGLRAEGPYRLEGDNRDTPIMHNRRVVGDRNRIKREKVAKWPCKPFTSVTIYSNKRIDKSSDEKKWQKIHDCKYSY